MFDSIYIGMTGLEGYSKGLRVIANNTANLSTPGFKSSSQEFADLFYSTQGSGSDLMRVGHGLNTTGTSLNFTQGDLRQTDNSLDPNNLDLAIDGQGLFTLRDDSGNLHYTRAGQFKFNSDGVLVNRTDGSKVMGVDATGNIGEITISGKSTAAGKATTNVKFTGNLSSAAPNKTINSVKVNDSLGGEHLLTVELTNDGATTPGRWLVKVLDGATVVDTGTIRFINLNPDPAQAKVTIDYAPAGVPAVSFVLDFSAGVTSFATGNLSTLDFTSQDGLGPGALTGVSVDNTGTLVMTFSNAQTAKGQKLSLGRFDSLDAVEAAGNNLFNATDSLAWHTGVAGEGGFGSIRSGMVELSNVDLTQEFSDLVIKQRGFQASSQIITTANEMIEQLFNMKGN